MITNTLNYTEHKKCSNCIYAALSNGVGYCMNRINNGKIITSWITCINHIDDNDAADNKNVKG